jgi:hypothetical protein
LTIPLEDYNGWNLPYSKTVNITCKDTVLESFVLPNPYQLEMSVNTYFGVIITGRPLPDPEIVGKPVETIQFTFDGLNGEMV